MSDQLIVSIEVLGVFTQCPGRIAFALEPKNPSNFREKVLVLCMQAARIARIIPQEECVWEAEGILIYKDIYGQFHLYFDTSKYSTHGPMACYEDGVGICAFLSARCIEEVMDFASRILSPVYKPE